MSAFLVSFETIDTIVAAAVLHGKTKPHQASAYGRRLINLNKQALLERYGDKIDRTDYAYRSVGGSDVQTYKSIECYLYQCSEGEVPSTDLFKEVESLSLIVGVTVGSVDASGTFTIKPALSAAYEAASWG